MARRFGCSCSCDRTCGLCGKPGSQPHTRATLARHAEWKGALGGIDQGPCPEPARWIPLADVEASLAPLRTASQARLAAGNRARLARLGNITYTGPRAL